MAPDCRNGRPAWDDRRDDRRRRRRPLVRAARRPPRRRLPAVLLHQGDGERGRVPRRGAGPGAGDAGARRRLRPGPPRARPGRAWDRGRGRRHQPAVRRAGGAGRPAGGDVPAGGRPGPALRGGVRRGPLAVPGGLRVGGRPRRAAGRRRRGAGRDRPGAAARRAGGGVGVLGVLPGAVAGGGRHLRRRGGRQPRAHRGARPVGVGGARRPVDDVLHPPRAAAARRGGRAGRRRRLVGDPGRLPPSPADDRHAGVPARRPPAERRRACRAGHGRSGGRATYAPLRAAAHPQPPIPAAALPVP